MVGVKCQPVACDREATTCFPALFLSHLCRQPYGILGHLDREHAANLATHRIAPLPHPIQPIDGVQDRSAFDAPRSKLERRANTVPVSFFP